MAETENTIEKKSIRVLIADDNPPTRLLLRAAISRWGYEIVEAKDGEEAWHIMQEVFPPQIVILDWLMPKLDGIAVCQRIKENKDCTAYIILLTRMNGTDNIIVGLEAGADEFLSKPFNMAELRSRISIGSRMVETQNKNKELQMMIGKLKEAINDHVNSDSQKQLLLTKMQQIIKPLDDEKSNQGN